MERISQFDRSTSETSIAGSLGLDVLSPHEAFGLHPLMTVTGESAQFAGAAVAVAEHPPVLPGRVELAEVAVDHPPLRHDLESLLLVSDQEQKLLDRFPGWLFSNMHETVRLPRHSSKSPIFCKLGIPLHEPVQNHVYTGEAVRHRP